MKYTCFFMLSGTEKEFDSLEEAQQAAEAYCGNSRYAKPFKREETFLYGPGDGTTSVMIRRTKCYA